MKVTLELSKADAKALKLVRADGEFMDLDYPMSDVTNEELVLALFRLGCEREQEDKGFEYLSIPHKKGK